MHTTLSFDHQCVCCLGLALFDWNGNWTAENWLSMKLYYINLFINYTRHIASILIGMTNAIPAKDINKTHQSNRLGIWLELFSRYIDSEWTKLHIRKYWLRHYSKFTAKNPIFSFHIRVHWLLFSFDTELELNPSMGCYDHCVDSICCEIWYERVWFLVSAVIQKPKERKC